MLTVPYEIIVLAAAIVVRRIGRRPVRAPKRVSKEDLTLWSALSSYGQLVARFNEVRSPRAPAHPRNTVCFIRDVYAFLLGIIFFDVFGFFFLFLFFMSGR